MAYNANIMLGVQLDYKNNWRKKSRKLLAAAFGGKCTVCGYDKTISALDYHHIDPANKDHLLANAMKNGHAWSKIAEEARKCTIVCCRCHREIHAGVTQLPDNYAVFNEEYAEVIKLQQKQFNECPICNELKNKRQDCCSLKCSQEKQRKFVIEKEELELLIQNNSYEKIGRDFGVTGSAVKKRCKLLGIVLQVRRK